MCLSLLTKGKRATHGEEEEKKQTYRSVIEFTLHGAPFKGGGDNTTNQQSKQGRIGCIHRIGGRPSPSSTLNFITV